MREPVEGERQPSPASGPFAAPGTGPVDAPGSAPPDAHRTSPFAAPPHVDRAPPGPFSLPTAGASGAAPYASVAGYGRGYAGPPKTDKGARTSLIVAIVGLVSTLFFCGIVLGPAAIVEGAKARRRIRLARGRLIGDGLAIAAIAIGILTVVINAVSLVIVIVASTNASRPR